MGREKHPALEVGGLAQAADPRLRPNWSSDTVF